MSILLDNAIKYCDENGFIDIRLGKKRNLSFFIENTCSDSDNIELEKVFDRFYRSDKARTYNGGFGIGLSIAKAIVQQHKGTIEAYKNEGNIGFKVILKN